MTQSATGPSEVLDFWLERIGPANWYRGSDEIDTTIQKRFADLWERARQRGLGWTPDARSALALIILLDQFPRNMFRGQERAFWTDRMARSRAKSAIAAGWDLRIEAPERQFFYLPLVHSECLEDQDRAVRLLRARLPDHPDQLLHARAHREVIRRFGRFPSRNAALGRQTSSAEAAFLAAGGYPALVDSLRPVT